jgi:hypothetical protein
MVPAPVIASARQAHQDVLVLLRASQDYRWYLPLLSHLLIRLTGHPGPGAYKPGLSMVSDQVIVTVRQAHQNVLVLLRASQDIVTIRHPEPDEGSFNKTPKNNFKTPDTGLSPGHSIFVSTIKNKAKWNKHNFYGDWPM